jgi:hypothetical protein
MGHPMNTLFIRRRALRAWLSQATCSWMLVLVVSGLAAGNVAAQQPANPTPQQRAAMLQQWMKASQMQLRSYEWVETTVVAKDGQEKSRKQNRCYYGADGKVQKTPIDDGSTDQSGGREKRLGKRVKEAAKEQMTDYMQSAVQLVHSYVPPDPARIQQTIAAGKFSATPSGQQVRLDFKDYLKPGDTLSTRLELPTNRLLGINVSSYLDSPADPVLLDVGMGVLPDGTIYTAKTVLDAKAKGLTVTVENSGHRKLAQ